MINYEIVIGIEVHTELNTKHKIFSPSINDINAKPNSNIHPIDLGFPGTLPRFNNEVLEKAIIVCNALEMDITRDMKWDRKNYFYPDNPKGFQITQQETPIGRNGKIVLENGKVITIDFMHMEEDTAKSFHNGEDTLLDFNRCGVPLLEIVTAPDLRSGLEAKEYLEKLRELLLYVDASDCKMEEGSLRVDVNISVMPLGQKEFNTKVEIKNLNSFANVQSAIEVEVKKQIAALNSGVEIKQATKRFNEGTKSVDIMRIKESAADYRFMTEPDLPRLTLTQKRIDDVLVDMPKLPSVIRKEILEEFKIETKICDILMSDKEMTFFFIKCVQANLNPKQIVNYLTVNINEYLNKSKVKFSDITIDVESFKQLESLLNSGKISTSHVKKIIPAMIEGQTDCNTIVKKMNIMQITDVETLRKFVLETLKNNSESIKDYKEGKDRAFGFLIGQIMKLSKGQANPKIINELLTEELDNA